MKTTSFASRHIGPRNNEIADMINEMGVSSLESLIAQTVPADILLE